MKIKIAFLTTRDSSGNPQIGDCIVITFGEIFDEEQRKACIVIDGGYSSSKIALKKYLEAEQIRIIDLIVATHIDNDHISGLKAFLKDYVKKKDNRKNKFELRNYWGPAPKNFSDSISIIEFVSYIENIDYFGIEELSFISQSVKANEELYGTITDVLTEGHIFHPSVHVRDLIPKIFKSIAVDILAPDRQIPNDKIKGQRIEEAYLGDTLASDFEIDLKDMTLRNKVNDAAIENNRTANNQSIVIKLTPFDKNGQRAENCTFLFTGDAEKESWEFMIRRWGNKLESELLKVSHHGSKTGTNKGVLRIVNPKYCIICAGKNQHGLPDKEVLKMIDKKNLEIFCTGRNVNVEEGPCNTNQILKKCPRWDNVNKKHIKDMIIFERNTDRLATTYSGKPCGFNWKNHP